MKISATTSSKRAMNRNAMDGLLPFAKQGKYISSVYPSPLKITFCKNISFHLFGVGRFDSLLFVVSSLLISLLWFSVCFSSVCSFNKLLLQKEELEQKHVHLLQVVESEKTAKWQYTQQCEELSTEIKKLRNEVNIRVFERCVCVPSCDTYHQIYRLSHHRSHVE